MNPYPPDACKVCRLLHDPTESCAPAETRVEAHARRVRLELIAAQARQREAQQTTDVDLPEVRDA